MLALLPRILVALLAFSMGTLVVSLWRFVCSPTPSTDGAPAKYMMLDAPQVGNDEPPPCAPENSMTISGGVLNAKAVSKPAPVYPTEARAARAHGTVTVRVVLDERGHVASAQAVSGHPLLRMEAEDAAREAKFSPTYLSGAPVRVSGVVTYNFFLE